MMESTGILQYSIINRLTSSLTSGNLIIDMIFTLLLTTIITGLFKLESYQRIWEWVKSFWTNTKNSVIIEYKANMSDQGWSNLASANGLNLKLLEAIDWYVEINNLVDQSARCVLSNTVMTNSDSEYMIEKSRPMEFSPNAKIKVSGEFNDITIMPTDKYGGDPKALDYTKKYVIISTKSVDNAKKFIQHCYNKYIENTYKNKDVETKYLFYPSSNNNNMYSSSISIVHNRFEINLMKTFDDIFFKQKDRFMNALDKFLSDESKINKFSLLLYGPPGTGKTSIIKALANYTKRHIQYVKLNELKSFNDAISIFFDSKVMLTTGAFYNIPTNKKIIVMEDIDVENQIVLKRPQPLPLPNMFSMLSGVQKDKVEEKKDLPEQEENILSLSDILQLLDGLFETPKTMIVMTSNNPENLDPALIRAGRVTMKLNLAQMDKEDAVSMIKSYFPEQKFDENIIPDKQIIPATLENMCQEYDDLNDVLYHLLEKDMTDLLNS